MILAAQRWNTNADLIADVHELGYLLDDDLVLDMTYGSGIWWRKWRPTNLVTNDLDPTRDTDDHEDFTALPYADGQFDAVTFDPPYIAQGGRSTSTAQDFLARYGLVDVPKTPGGVQALINAGLSEAVRVVKPRGVVIVKCKDYVTSGHVWPGTHYTLSHGLELACTLQDRFEHVNVRVGMQPSGRRQQHARRNLSTLFVFRAPK